MQTSETRDSEFHLFEKGGLEIEHYIEVLLKLDDKDEECDNLLKEISSISSIMMRGALFTKNIPIINTTFALMKNTIDFMIHFDKNRILGTEESNKEMNEKKTLVEKSIISIKEESQKERVLNIEDATFRLLIGMHLFYVSVMKRNNETFKKREKKCALFLSQIIKHAKSSNSEELSEEIFKTSQNLVTMARCSLEDKLKFLDFIVIYEKMISLLDKFIEILEKEKAKAQSSENQLKILLKKKSESKDQSNNLNKQQIENTLSDWFGVSPSKNLENNPLTSPRNEKKKKKWFNFGKKKKGTIDESSIIMSEKEKEELELRITEKEKENARKANLAKKAREKREEDMKSRKEFEEKESNAFQKRLNLIKEGKVRDTYDSSKILPLNPKKQKAMKAREKRLTSNMVKSESIKRVLESGDLSPSIENKNDQLEQEKQEKLEKEKLENERLEKENKEKLEKERLEKERLEKEKLEKERLEKEKKEKLEKEKKEKLKKEKIRKEKLRKEKERKLREKKKKEKLEKEKKQKENNEEPLEEIPNSDEEPLEEIEDEEEDSNKIEPLVNMITVCVSCGEEGKGEFCASCGGKMVEIEDNSMHSQQKVCMSCGEEGKDTFCATCGGEMVDLHKKPEDRESNENYFDEAREPIDLVLVCIDCGEEGVGELCKHCGGELVEIEEQEPDLEIVKELENEEGDVDDLLKKYGVKGKKKNLDQLLDEEYGMVEIVEEELPPPPREVDAGDVFIVDLGTDCVKYGWRSEKEPYLMKNEIANTGMSSLNIHTRPIESSNFDFLKNNEHFVDIMRKVLKVGCYQVSNPLLITSSVPTFKEAPNELSDKFFESEYCSEPPAKFYIGYSPLLSSFSVFNSLTPTCILIDSGASMTTIVPIYFGSVIEHARQTASFGGKKKLFEN